MSWPYVAAAWRVMLPHVQKHLLNAMADQADPAGFVSASVRELAKMCGMSDRTVQRTRDELAKKGFARIVQPGTPVASHRYRLQLPGVRVTPGVSLTPGVSESGKGCQAVGSLLPCTDPSKSIKAEPAAPPPYANSRPRRKETPTRDQVTKLVHVLLDDPVVEIREPGDLDEMVKTACARADFLYDSAVVDDGIKRALAARGINPKNWRAGDVQQARRRR